MSTIKIGFIGAGAVGQMHIRHWSALEGCQVLALADLRPKLRSLVAEKYAIPLQHESHKELLSNPEIDAVVVVVARHHTAEVVSDCAAAGKHVFSEKPMAKTLKQACQLADLADSHRVLYSIGYQRCHDAGTEIGKRALENLVFSGELGKVVLVRSWNFTGQDRVPGQDIMTDEDRPVASLWEQAPEWMPKDLHFAYDRFINVYSHDVSMLRYLFGKTPKINYASLDNGQGQVAVFDFGDFLGTFEGGLNELNSWEERGEWDQGIEICFEKGRLIIKFSPPLMHDLSSVVELIKGRTKTLLNSGLHKTPAFQLQAEHFLNAIRGKVELLTSGRRAVDDSAFIESVWWQHLAQKGVLAGRA